MNTLCCNVVYLLVGSGVSDADAVYLRSAVSRRTRTTMEPRQSIDAPYTPVARYHRTLSTTIIQRLYKFQDNWKDVAILSIWLLVHPHLCLHPQACIPHPRQCSGCHYPPCLPDRGHNLDHEVSLYTLHQGSRGWARRNGEASPFPSLPCQRVMWLDPKSSLAKSKH